jgi:hypothetical protein
MDKKEHPESSQDPPPELFEPLTMKKILAPSLEVKEEAASTPPALPPSEELQEPVPLEEEFNPACHLNHHQKKSSTLAPS